MNDLFFFAIVFLAGVMTGLIWAKDGCRVSKRGHREADDELSQFEASPESHEFGVTYHDATASAGPITKPSRYENFPVARADRRPTWRERRRELEAKARTKRKAYEEWRD